MRRIDRAIFAIFLLALVADVARSYALTPVSPDLSGNLILSAASQFQNGSQVEAVSASRRVGNYPSLIASRVRRAPVLTVWSRAAWSKGLFNPTAQWSQVALLPPAAILAPQSAYRADTSQAPPSLSLDRIEHAGNPAP